MGFTIKTERLGLRNWNTNDVNPMSEINKDPRVMQYFPSTQDKAKTLAFIEKMQLQFEENGYCYFATELLKSKSMVGFVGLAKQTFMHPLTPFVDIGWRLSYDSWGKGYATEAARASMKFAWTQTGLDKIYCVIPVNNKASQNVAQKLGMELIDTFDHPLLVDYPEVQRCQLLSKKRPTL